MTHENKQQQQEQQGQGKEQEQEQEEFYFPNEQLEALFHDVATKPVFPDRKTFVDCVPRMPPKQIVEEYKKQKNESGFDLQKFVYDHFDIVPTPTNQPVDCSDDLLQHLHNLWDKLVRTSENVSKYSTLIPLPKPYVVPGGRFREMFYWDTYFTILGLLASQRLELVENILDNFAYLVNKFGFIPNGNRTYFLNRTQPPFFASMIMAYAEHGGLDKALAYLPALEIEYKFWMCGADTITDVGSAAQRVVKMAPDVFLNRYWSEKEISRPEAYTLDMHLPEEFKTEEQKKTYYRNMRAACESGWDFSSRWFKNGDHFFAVSTTDFLPVDLNCLVYNMEKTISILNNHHGNTKMAQEFEALANKRKQAILQVFWSEEQKFFKDYDFVLGEQRSCLSLAGCYPLFFEIATPLQAQGVAELISTKFLAPGGLVTTLKKSGEQWDYPLGWPPLQWIAIKGLRNYNFNALADEITDRWLNLNRQVYQRTKKMVEKYNVVDIHLEAGGGNYPTQDGFGWTNGVACALLTEKLKAK